MSFPKLHATVPIVAMGVRSPEDFVPCWDYGCTDIPNTGRDESAASIMVSALYEPYTQTGKNCGFLLLHSTGSVPHGMKIDKPLVYADYYFLEALQRKKIWRCGGTLLNPQSLRICDYLFRFTKYEYSL